MTGQESSVPTADADRIRSHLGDVDGLFVALDFDGTLAPIAEDPDAPTITGANRELLSELADRPEATVAVVSGRQLSDLRDRVGIDGVRYAGNHGLEHTEDGERVVHPKAAAREIELREVHDAVESRVAHVRGVEIENKELTVTVHYRRTPADRTDAVREAVADVVSTYDQLETTEGKQIVEIRPTVDWDKGAAVQLLAEGAPDDWPTVYVGDDTTDEDAFRTLGPSDLGVLVGGGETAATYRVLTQEDVSRLLEWLIAALDEES